MHKTITIFGGSGFIGRYIVQKFVQEGYNIRIPTRNAEKAKFIKTMGNIGQVTIIPLNIANPEHLRDVIKNADIVINLIGILYETHKETFCHTHIELPKHIAKICKELDIKNFIHFSAIGANIKSEAQYSRSKGQGENELQRIFPETTIIRPSIVFGHEDKFFNFFAKMATILPILPLIGGGHTKFQPVYVSDIALAVSELVKTKKFKGRTLELGGPEIYTFRELLETLLMLIQKNRILVSIPFPLAIINAFFLQLLPNPLLTIDQVRLLKHNNITGPQSLGFKELNIVPRHLISVVPFYLQQYCKKTIKQQNILQNSD